MSEDLTAESGLPSARGSLSARKLAPGKKRRGGRLTEKRRQEIVRRAVKLFLDRGYEQVSIDDIVAEIGGSKRTLYARFGGKAGLFGTVIAEYCAAVDRDLEVSVDESQ